MIELKGQQIVFSFPEVHPDCRLTVTLHRTLRIPDDGKKYPLPPSLGQFPAVHLDDYAARVPKKWLGRGGIAVPMWQSEAMWLQFQPSTPRNNGNKWPFAVKIACGKVSAVTGKKWSKQLKVNDYLVCPLQPWIDGFATDEGQVKQFIAAALGFGATVEGQVTGKEEFGGIQLEVIPMSLKDFNARFPDYPTHQQRGLVTHSLYGSNIVGSSSGSSFGSGVYSVTLGSSLLPTHDSHTGYSSNSGSESVFCSNSSSGPLQCVGSALTGVSANDHERSVEAPASLDMGMGMGGRMEQQIFKDPYGLEVWSKKHKSRLFIHLCNSLGWKNMTNSEPPTVPITAARYTASGYPWFEYYEENASVQKGTSTLKKVKSVAEFSKKNKIPLLPENQSTNIPAIQVKMWEPKQRVAKVARKRERSLSR